MEKLYYKNNTNFLGIAIEDDILNETINKNWIIKCLGPEKHESIMNERIICIGTFWGSLNEFLEFSIIFWDRLIKNRLCVEQLQIIYFIMKKDLSIVL